MAPAGSPRARLPLRRIAAQALAGTFDSGFTHAGNLAYLSLVTLFPFVILIASVAGWLGRTRDGMAAVDAFLAAVPADVAALIAGPIRDVVAAPAASGVITFGVVVALWTSSGVLVTIRALLQQAYGMPSALPAWRWRLIGLAETLALVLVLLIAFAAQVLVTGAETFVFQLMPLAAGVFPALGVQRLGCSWRCGRCLRCCARAAPAPWRPPGPARCSPRWAGLQQHWRCRARSPWLAAMPSPMAAWPAW